MASRRATADLTEDVRRHVGLCLRHRRQRQARAGAREPDAVVRSPSGGRNDGVAGSSIAPARSVGIGEDLREIDHDVDRAGDLAPRRCVSSHGLSDQRFHRRGPDLQFIFPPMMRLTSSRSSMSCQRPELRWITSGRAASLQATTPCTDHLGPADDRGHRRAELVRDHRDEFILEALASSADGRRHLASAAHARSVVLQGTVPVGFLSPAPRAEPQGRYRSVARTRPSAGHVALSTGIPRPLRLSR